MKKALKMSAKRKHGRIKVYGMGSQGDFNYIVVKKEKQFFYTLEEMLNSTFGGFPHISFDYDKNDMEIEKDISKYIDKHEFYYSGDKDIRVDVFFGHSKIFIIVRLSLENRKKFIKALEKYAHFIEPKERKR